MGYSNWERTFGLIRCPPSTFVHITNLNWNIQPGYVLNVYDGRHDESPILLVSEISIEGNNWSAYASSNELYFTFTSDGTSTAAGYDISFECPLNGAMVVDSVASGNFTGTVTDSGGILNLNLNT